MYCPVLGSSIVRERFARSNGKTLAEGCSEPFLQKAGLLGPRNLAANQTRPFRSNMPLWLFALLSQTFPHPSKATAASVCRSHGPVRAPQAYRDPASGPGCSWRCVYRIEDGNHIDAEFGGAIHRAISVDRRVTPIRGDQVVR